MTGDGASVAILFINLRLEGAFNPQISSQISLCWIEHTLRKRHCEQASVFYPLIRFISVDLYAFHRMSTFCSRVKGWLETCPAPAAQAFKSSGVPL